MAKKGIYKNKIKTLLKNNRVLALALQSDRAKKEELIEENKHNANIIMFSRLKLASLSNNLKTVVSIVDETLTLLQKHSSVSSSKYTPKNTVGHVEFKEQVKDVFMDPIPEEPASPQEKANKKSNETTCLDKRQFDHFKEKAPQEINVDLFDKIHQNLEKPKKCGRLQKCSKEMQTSEKEKLPMKDFNTLKQKDFAKSISVNKYEGKSPDKLVKNKVRKLASRRKASQKNVLANQTASKNMDNTNGKNKKRVRSPSANNKENSSPVKNKFYKSKSCNGTEILVVEKLENNTNENTDVACTHKKSVSPIKLIHDNVSDTYVISDCEKENRDSNKKPKTSAKKLKSLGEDELITAITTKRTYGRSSALKSLSSRINIENSKDICDKGKSSQLDDLITTKQKSAGLIWDTKSPDIYDESKSYLQDLSLSMMNRGANFNLHQEQMVKNLAENTFLVTAEVHKNLESLKSDNKFKMTKSLPKSECLPSKQPIVLVRDIFESGKTFCKSISPQSGNELSGIPLELQLLKHCSSLKVIPEESIHSEDSTIDPIQQKPKETNVKHIELSLPYESEKVNDEQVQEKRAFRKRSATINYKGPKLNVKMRR